MPRPRAIDATRPPVAAFAVLAVASASGAVALVYEVVFFRALTLLFGAAIHAVAAVVAAFLGGLGLGAWLCGRRLARAPIARPLVGYAALEACIGAFGLASPLLFRACERLTRLEVFAPPTAGGAAVPWAIVAFAFVLIGLPALLMGATFPLLVRAIDGGDARDARGVGRVYGWNTIGAFVGAISCAFLLLPEFGQRATSSIAAAGNFVLALSAFALGRSAGAPRPAATEPPVASSRRPPILLLLAVALIGASVVGMQVVGNRLLIGFMGGTVHAFAAVLATFLLGIGVGGAFLGGPLARRSAPITALAWSAIVLAGSVGLGMQLLRWRLGVLDGGGGDVDPMLGGRNLGEDQPGLGLLGYLIGTMTLAALTFLPVTLVSGAFLPAAIRRVRDGAGLVYGVNTAGSIAGSLVAGFFLLPTFGLRVAAWTMAAVAIVAAGVLLALAARCGEAPRRRGVLALLATAVAAAVVLAVGLRRGPPALASDDVEILFYREAAASAVRVEQVRDASEQEPVRCLLVDGKVVATSLLMDRRLQYLLGFIPTLIRPHTDRILSIALGTGMSSGALAMPGGESVTIVELSSGVIEACPLFDRWTGGVLDRKNVHLVQDDGRAYLRRSRETYDLISADPIHPWIAGTAFLYSQEYYRLARDHLAPDGLMSQWIPLYELSEEDVAGIVLTFRSVFPHASAWMTGYDLVLLGSPSPIVIDPDAAAFEMLREPLRSTLAGIGIRRVEDLLGCWFGGNATLERFSSLAAARGPITDDRPWIEFTAPRNVFGGYVLGAFRELASSPERIPLSASASPDLRERIDDASQRLRSAALEFADDVARGRPFGLARADYSEKLRAGYR